MKLEVTYELNITPENEALIAVIALQEGWSPESDMTAQEYVNKYVTAPKVKILFNQIVEQAVRTYFGIVGKAKADAVMSQYESAHSVTSEFTND